MNQELERKDEAIEEAALFRHSPDLGTERPDSWPLFGGIEDLRAQHGEVRNLKQRVLHNASTFVLAVLLFGALYLAILLLE